MKLKVTLVKSPIASIPNHIKIVEALGLRKLNQEKIHYDTPSIRGMIFKVRHLLRVEEIVEVVEEAKEIKPAKAPKPKAAEAAKEEPKV